MSTPDNASSHDGPSLQPDPVPRPDSGVRGSDAADRMDPEHGTARGADGETAAREQMRVDLGERSPQAGREDGDDLEQAAAVGETDDPAAGSLGAHGS